MKYVVAFNRDRDSYQVPLALAEIGILECLITDLYLPQCVAESFIAKTLKLNHRFISGLPFKLVRSNFIVVLAQLRVMYLLKNEDDRLAVFGAIDTRLSLSALRFGLSEAVGYFLYSGYARECFESDLARDKKKLLFVYHPHGDLCSNILVSDRALHEEVKVSHDWHMAAVKVNDTKRLNAEYLMSDAVVCASDFTRKSLLYAHGDNELISIVPYGCMPIQLVDKGAVLKRPVEFLFVGQGVQRKGLHHLLKAWGKNFTGRARLTIVASKIDPGISCLADQCDVLLLPAQSREALSYLFSRSDVFVMPSLVEGFGLVYLEALSAGCHVVGTLNTGLPDLDAPDWAVSIVPVGDIGHLQFKIDLIIKNAEYYCRSSEIQGFAASRSWAKFRAGIRGFVEKFS